MNTLEILKELAELQSKMIKTNSGIIWNEAEYFHRVKDTDFAAIAEDYRKKEVIIHSLENKLEGSMRENYRLREIAEAVVLYQADTPLGKKAKQALGEEDD